MGETEPEGDIELDGEIETDVDWDENLNDKNSDEYKEAESQLEEDLKEIMEADEDIDEVTMTDCDFEPSETQEGRKRRQASSQKAHATFSLLIKGRSAEAAQAAAEDTIENADPTSFPSLNSASAASFKAIKPATN